MPWSDGVGVGVGVGGGRALWAGLGMGKSFFSWENHGKIGLFKGKSWEYLGTEERMDEYG